MYGDHHRAKKKETSPLGEERHEPVTGQNPNRSSFSGISPIKAFAGLVALLIVSGAIILLTKPETSAQDSEANIAASDNFALTDAEAITRFRTLRRLLIRAVASRDVSLLPAIFTSDSPNMKETEAAIHRLLRDRVIDKSRVHIISVEVLNNWPERIRISERVRLVPCFIAESGRDVTASNKIVEQVNRWVLVFSNSSWKLAKGVLQDDRIIRSMDDSCS